MQAATQLSPSTSQGQAPSSSDASAGAQGTSTRSRGLVQRLKTASFDDGEKMLQPPAEPGPVQMRRAPVAAGSGAGAPVQMEAAPAGAAGAGQDLTPLFDQLAGAYFPGTQANAQAFIATQPAEVRPALEARLAAYVAQWKGADARTRTQLKTKWKGQHASYAEGAPSAPAAPAAAATEAPAGPATEAPAEAASAQETPAAAEAPAENAEPQAELAPRDQVEKMVQALETTHATNAARGKATKLKTAKKGYWNGNIREQLLKGKLIEGVVEYTPEQAAQVAKAIGDARALVEKLGAADLGVAPAAPGTDAKAAKKAEDAAVREGRGKYHRRLNRVEPYFTQMTNASILGDKGSSTNDKGETKEWTEAAWKGTCNLTSVASALMARGKSPNDFAGGGGKDRATLERVATALDPKAFADPSAIYSLRMPDFIQLVYILNKLSGGGSDPASFRAAVLASQKSCRSTTTNLVLHNGVVAMFGVKQLLFSTDFQTSAKHFKVKGQFSQQAYATQLQAEFIPRLNRGEQVTINKPGHIVRLVDMTADGIMIDDSAYEGAKFSMDWAKCAAENYFRAHAVYF